MAVSSAPIECTYCTTPIESGVTLYPLPLLTSPLHPPHKKSKLQRSNKHPDPSWEQLQCLQHFVNRYAHDRCHAPVEIDWAMKDQFDTVVASYSATYMVSVFQSGDCLECLFLENDTKLRSTTCTVKRRWAREGFIWMDFFSIPQPGRGLRVSSHSAVLDYEDVHKSIQNQKCAGREKVDDHTLLSMSSLYENGPEQDMMNAIESIPAYVGLCELFLVLCPHLIHRDQ